MPFDSGGTFNALPPPTFPAVSGTTIRADYFNAIVNDINSGLTQVSLTELAFSTAIQSSANGSGVDKVGGAGRVVTNITALRALLQTGVSTAFVTGYYSPHDGGGGVYTLDLTDTTTADNGGTVIVATDNGRWKLDFTAVVHLRQFGVHSDLTTDDTSFIQAALSSGVGCIDGRGVTCLASSTINIQANQTFLVSGSTFHFTGTSATLFSAVVVNNWAFVGPFTITGDLVSDPGTSVSSKGFLIQDCANWRVSDPTVKNVQGYGMYVTPGSSTRARGDGGVVTNPKFDANVWGWHDEPGSGSEYCTVINVRAINNAQAGVETAAGNINWIGGHVLDNIRDGFRVLNGPNNAHGIVNGLNINHNPQYNIMTSQVLNGQSFEGCHIYGLGAAQGAIFLDRSKGISFNGGHLDCEVYNYKDSNSGMNMIDGAYCPGGYGIARLPGSNNGHDQLVIKNCFGPGVYAVTGGNDTTGLTINDPAICYAAMQRDAASTQTLTNGSAVVLAFSSLPFPDRRATLILASGSFTTPANQAGLYHIDIDLLFGGTTVNSGASIVELKVGSTSKKLFLSTAFGTSKLQVQGSVELYLNANDVVTLVATISVASGSPTFGDSTWPSNVEFRRIA